MIEFIVFLIFIYTVFFVLEIRDAVKEVYMDEYIEKIMNHVECKHDNPSTISKKFKHDIIEWSMTLPKQSKTIVELGTHKGHTTYILSHFFDRVYTVNLPGRMDSAMDFNKDRTNIKYIELDIYKNYKIGSIPDSYVLFSDAVHTYDAVQSDYEIAKTLNCKYIIFDDYGLIAEVRKCVDDLIKYNLIEFVKFMGHDAGHKFDDSRTLMQPEGVLAMIVYE